MAEMRGKSQTMPHHPGRCQSIPDCHTTIETLGAGQGVLLNVDRNHAPRGVSLST
jgi:hypothetical protein